MRSAGLRALTRAGGALAQQRQQAWEVSSGACVGVRQLVGGCRAQHTWGGDKGTSIVSPPALWAGVPQQQALQQRRLLSSEAASSSSSDASSSSTSSDASSSRTSSSSGGNDAGNAVLSNTTSYLRNWQNGAEIFLVGTAHVSRRSAEEVREMIRLVRPDTVLVELCAGRAARLRAGQPASELDFFKDIFSMLAPGGRGGGGGFGQTLFKLSVGGMYRFLKSLGMDVGGEFVAAMEEADRIGARVVYGDRDVHETLQRLAGSLDLRDVLRMLAGGGFAPPPQALVDFFNGNAGASFESQVEAMKTRAMAREMTNYMRQVNPQLTAALIDERDQFMVDKLREQRGRVVAVVGLGHLDGIEKRFNEGQAGPQ